MASAILYTFFHALKPSTYMLTDKESSFKGFPGFILSYAIIMDLASLITTPCFMIFSLYAQPGNPSTLREEASTGSGWLAFAMCFQSAILLFGIFITPVASDRPIWYNIVMPEAKLYSTKAATLVLPWIIIGFSVFEQINRVSA